jgi:hypothetical protein
MFFTKFDQFKSSDTPQLPGCSATCGTFWRLSLTAEDACCNSHLPREIFGSSHLSSKGEPPTTSETEAFQFCGQRTRCEHGSFWEPSDSSLFGLIWMQRFEHCTGISENRCTLYARRKQCTNFSFKGTLHVWRHNVFLQTNEYTYYYNTFLVMHTYCFTVFKLSGFLNCSQSKFFSSIWQVLNIQQLTIGLLGLFKKFH